MGEHRESESRHRLIRKGRVLYGADAIVAKWVARRVPNYTVGPETIALGVIGGKDLVAGVTYERFNGVHMEVAIAAEVGTNWASKETLQSLFAYPFVQLGCEAISVLVPSSNPVSLNLATKLGFEPEALVRFAAHDGSTLVVLKMLRNTCKWIEGDGQKRRRQSASGP